MVATPSTGRRLPILPKYEVLEELGHGGMATVYRAHDTRLGRDVAVKVLHPHLRTSTEVAHRFAVEAKAVAKLRHPNIVEVFDVSSAEESEQYLVVELLRGKTLRKLLAENGVMPPEVAAGLGLELLAALVHAHEEGVVHRDVKPENVLIEHRARPAEGADESAARALVKLTDFGIAKLLDAQGVTSTGQVLGSPAHMAPEQIEGGDVDGRADVFGLGVLLYECMVGHLPFEGSNPAQVLRRVLDGDYAAADRERPEIGKAWSGLLDRALARDVADRFADAASMRDAIARECRRLGVETPRVELEAWLDDPAEYARAHTPRMIARLCELGSEARRAKNALVAASDYNRALAYAPADAQLLRVVAGMDRAEARSRLLRKALPLGGALVAALGVAAFALRHAPLPKIVPVEPVPLPGPPVESNPALPPSDPTAAATLPPPSASATAPRVSPTLVVSPASAHATAPAVHRVVTITHVRPVGGVTLFFDETRLGGADRKENQTIAIDDDKPHVLHASCVNDMCEPRSYAIAPTEKTVALAIELSIRDARLVVQGNPLLHYGVREWPGIPVILGASASIPMKNGVDQVHLEERETGRSFEIVLRAGQQTPYAVPEAPP